MRHPIVRDFMTATFLRGVILRHRELGTLCGYVGVAPGHPLHGVKYMEESPCLRPLVERRLNSPMPESPGLGLMLAAILGGEIKPTPEHVFDVHGGITYSSDAPGEEYPVPSADLWWFGFDCAHSGDQSPGLERMSGVDLGGELRDEAFVTEQIERLSQQLAEVGP